MAVGVININQFSNIAHLYHLEGNSNDGVGSLNGTDTSVTYSNAKFRQGAFFNGSTSNSSFSSLWITGTGNFTILAWVKTSTTGTRNVFISGGNSTNNNGFFFFINTSNQLEFDVSGTAGATSTKTVTDGLWHLVSVVNTSNSQQLFVDGVPSGAPSALTPNFTTATSFFGKDFFNNTFYAGALDEVCFITTNLSNKQIKDYYSWSKGTRAVII